MRKSETSRVRESVLPHLKGYGVDLGYGGDSISPTAIAIDLHRPYTKTGNDPQHLAGDCRRLHWFADGVLDYVYSSHLMEDFEDLPAVLTEWLRVIKPGGILALCLPDEKKYRAYCKAKSEGRNMKHSHENLTMNTILDIVTADTVVAKEFTPYSFLVVMRKQAV